MFKEAFRKGLENAELIEIQKEQIHNVFKELITQILEVTGGKIQLSLGKETKKDCEIAYEDRLKNYLGTNNGEVELSNEIYLLANCQHSERALCEYKDKDGGFPVTLVYKGIYASAYDEISLISILQELIAEPQTSTIFKGMLDK